MEEPTKDIMVLGAIKSGAKKFDKIKKITRIEPEELNQILEDLEKQGEIEVREKSGFLGKKIELVITEKGDKKLEETVAFLQKNWEQMSVLYKAGDKQKLKEQMDQNKSFFPMMMFFGVIDIMMFSMMFSMMGAMMTDYVPADQIPEGMDGGDHGDAGMDDGGGMDFDIGF